MKRLLPLLWVIIWAGPEVFLGMERDFIVEVVLKSAIAAAVIPLVENCLNLIRNTLLTCKPLAKIEDRHGETYEGSHPGWVAIMSFYVKLAPMAYFEVVVVVRSCQKFRQVAAVAVGSVECYQRYWCRSGASVQLQELQIQRLQGGFLLPAAPSHFQTGQYFSVEMLQTS